MLEMKSYEFRSFQLPNFILSLFGRFQKKLGSESN